MKGKFPIHRASGALFDCYADFKAAAKGWYDPPYSYGVFGTDTVLEFEAAIAEREGANHALAFPSGMGAIAATLMGLVSKDETILIQKDVYTVTGMFADKQLSRFGIEVQQVDPVDPETDFAALYESGARVLYLENPSYKNYETIDLAPVIERAKQAGLLTVVDNSLLTFLNSRPLDEGADAVIYSASKYISGHGDSLLGVVTTNNEDVFKAVRDTQILSGYVTSPEDCALALRGLETLDVRLRHQAAEADKLKRELAKAPWVKEVKSARYSVTDGTITKDDTSSFPIGTGLLSITFDDKLTDDQLNTLTKAFNKVKVGYGWGSTTSIALPQNDDPEKTTMRISVGMQTADELFEELQRGYHDVFPGRKKQPQRTLTRGV